MKILHVPFCFYPDPVGGTEIYVADLAREQQRQGHDAVICAPALYNSAYAHEGLRVQRFAVSANVTNVTDLYDAGDLEVAHRFGEILDEEQPDLLHLHAFTRGASLRLIQEAKRRRIATVFSYHTPTVSCMRGTLLRNGTEVCDGYLNVQTCASCNLDRLGVPRPINAWLGSIPLGVGRAISRIKSTGSIVTALRMTELVDLRHKAFRSLMRDVDHVIALCNWTLDLLLLNGVPADKLSLSRQGLYPDLVTSRIPRPPHSDFRIAFLGRLAPEKGLHILIDALRKIPSAPVTLDVYGISQTTDGEHLAANQLPTSDSRVNFHAPLTRQDLLPTLQNYDVLAVPSQWLETGPMVVMEAFAAGIPVIGSRLGGIAELVDHNVNGLLIGPDSVPAWAAAIIKLAADRSLLDRLRAGIAKQRTVRDAAREVEAVYAHLVPHAITAMAVSH